MGLRKYILTTESKSIVNVKLLMIDLNHITQSNHTGESVTRLD